MPDGASAAQIEASKLGVVADLQFFFADSASWRLRQVANRCVASRLRSAAQSLVSCAVAERLSTPRFDIQADWSQARRSQTHRLDYLLFIQDLLRSTAPSFEAAIDRPVKGLDIGTGSTAIYPLLGCKLSSSWSFFASGVSSSRPLSNWARPLQAYAVRCFCLLPLPSQRSIPTLLISLAGPSRATSSATGSHSSRPALPIHSLHCSVSI